jgi:hypothetical protein
MLPAGRVDDLAGDEGGVCGGEERHYPSDVGRLTDPAQGERRPGLGPLLRVQPPHEPGTRDPGLRKLADEPRKSF